MSKFDMSALMNDTSKKDIDNNSYKVEFINILDIKESAQNFYQTDDVSDLKQSIELVGLRQNIEVFENDGHFEIISGHRRHKACLELFNEGNQEFSKIPCRVVKGINKIEAEIQLIFGNAVNRELNDYEKMTQVSKLKELLSKWEKEQGKIDGRKRDIIADILKISKSQVGRYEAIDNNLIEPLKEELKSGNVNLTTAVELSKLDEGEQNEQHEKIIKGEKVTATKILNETKQNKVEDEEKEDISPNAERFEEIIESVDNGFDENKKIVPIVDTTNKDDNETVVPIMDTTIETVHISDKEKREVIESLIKKYNGKVSVVSSNINKYISIGREPSKSDVDEQTELNIIIEALIILKGRGGI